MMASTGLHLRVAARTHCGCVRQSNEDNLLVASVAGPRHHADEATASVEVESPGMLLGVCDGMGGAAAGEVASRMAVEHILRDVVQRSPVGRESLHCALLRSVESASRAIHQAAKKDRQLEGMGTTSTICALFDHEMAIAHVGDSRAYLMRDGELFQMTRDQTLATMMMERGQLTVEEAGDFEEGHVILQALGVDDHVEVDLIGVRVCKNDVLLVCSDGLYGVVGKDAIRETLSNHESSRACEELVKLALSAGAPDNVTCIVAHLDGSSLTASNGEAPAISKVVLPASDLEPAEPIPDEPLSQEQSWWRRLVRRLFRSRK